MWDSKWWNRPRLGQLTGPQPAPLPHEVPLGSAAPFGAYSPTKPPDFMPAGRLGAWFPTEDELRQWGGAELIEQPITGAPAGFLGGDARRLVMARFPIPLTVTLSLGVTDNALLGGPVNWQGPLAFKVTIGCAAGDHTLFVPALPPVGGVFSQTLTLAARMIQVDCAFVGPVPNANAVRVWAGVAVIG